MFFILFNHVIIFKYLFSIIQYNFMINNYNYFHNRVQNLNAIITKLLGTNGEQGWLTWSSMPYQEGQFPVGGLASQSRTDHELGSNY